MPSPLKLSVLDQSPAAQEKTQDHAIRESLALARHCDVLGYHRYWVSEHHNSASIVGTAPEVLMAAIAATTQRIRVGSADVGAWELSQLCGELEATGRDNALDGAAELMTRAEAIYPLVRAALEDVRQEALDHAYKPRKDDHDS